MISSNAVIGICAALSASIFIGYCIYFDKVRHNDPNFKKKLRERRRVRQAALSASKKEKTICTDSNMTEREAILQCLVQKANEMFPMSDKDREAMIKYLIRNELVFPLNQMKEYGAILNVSN